MPYDDLRKGRFSQVGQAYFITTVLADREQRYLSHFECARIVVRNMKLLHDDKRVNSFAWVVMPDHIHWLFQLGDNASLSSIIKLFKGRTAQLINTYLGRNGTLWQKNLALCDS